MRTDRSPERTRGRGDGGFTLIELIVTMVLFSLVGTAAMAGVMSIMKSSAAGQERAAAIAQAQLALNHMARQVRSGNVLNEPAAEDADWRLLIYTQANGTNHCVIWRAYFADSGPQQAGTLTYTSWIPGSPDLATTQKVASGLEVSSTESPFVLDPAAAYGSRLLQIDLPVRTGPNADDVDTVTTSVAARNTQYDYPIGIC